MQNERIIRRPEVEHISGRGRSDIYSGMAEGTFPKNIRIGKRSVGWIESEIFRWVSERIEKAKQLQAEAEEAVQDKAPEQEEEDEDAEEIEA